MAVNTPILLIACKTQRFYRVLIFCFLQCGWKARVLPVRGMATDWYWWELTEDCFDVRSLSKDVWDCLLTFQAEMLAVPVPSIWCYLEDPDEH